MSGDGTITEDYTGTGTQASGLLYGDSIGGGVPQGSRTASRLLQLGAGPVLFSESASNCDDPSTADEQCSTDVGGSSSASAASGPGVGEGVPSQSGSSPQVYYRDPDTQQYVPLPSRNNGTPGTLQRDVPRPPLPRPSWIEETFQKLSDWLGSWNGSGG